MSTIFTRCAGLYHAAALIQQAADKGFRCQVMTDHADGAEKVVMPLLMVSGTSEDQAEVMASERRHSQTAYHITFLQAGRGDPRQDIHQMHYQLHADPKRGAVGARCLRGAGEKRQGAMVADDHRRDQKQIGRGWKTISLA
jgi:hypothetical protein